MKTAKGGECFIKTQSLDGETNLKPKLPIKSINEVSNEEIEMHCIKPDADLYHFKGKVQVKEKSHELDIK